MENKHKLIVTPTHALDQRNMNGFKEIVIRALAKIEVEALFEIKWGSD